MDYKHSITHLFMKFWSWLLSGRYGQASQEINTCTDVGQIIQWEAEDHKHEMIGACIMLRKHTHTETHTHTHTYTHKH